MSRFGATGRGFPLHGRPLRPRDVSHLDSATEISQHLALALWCLHVLSTPFYVFESGLPQFADYVLVLLFCALLLMQRLKVPHVAHGVFFWQIMMVLYFTVVNFCWTVVISDSAPLSFSSFYIYNLAGCLVFLSMFHWMGRRFLVTTAWMVFLSLAIQFSLSFIVYGRHQSRATIFFNSPNQLGYHLLLSSTIVWILGQTVLKRNRTGRLMELAVYAMAVLMTLATLSRAALASLLILLGLRMTGRERLVAFSVVSGLGLFLYFSNFSTLESFQKRTILKTMTVEDERYHRGYDRLMNHPEYLILGAGEGAYDRFDSELYGELHSSIGTIFFCYGLVGLALFTQQLWSIWRQCGFAALVFITPALCHCVTHNGLRQLEFWILLCLIPCVMNQRGTSSGSSPPKSP